MSLIRAAAALAALVFLLTQGHTALHSSQSPEPPVTPDWLQPSAVWHFSMGNLVPCAWCDTEQFYEDIDQSGATVAGFMDFRWWQTNWRALAPTVARNARERGLHPLAALSQVGWWPESDHTPRPSDLESAVALDPYGNRRQEDMGGTQGHVVIHSALEPGWEAYLTASAQTFIDAGFEGLVIDDGAYVGDGYDFRPALLDEFNAYLAATRPASELDALAQSLGFSSFSQFDYAQVWRDRLPADTTALTDEVWNTRWDMHIPLWEEFDGFRRLRTHEVMGRIFTNVKSYARENYGREIPTAFNLSELPFSALPFLDLIDYVDLEASYSTSFFGTTTPEYFPSSRRTADIKLLDFLGLSAKVVTLFGGARVEIASRGTENTALYRTLIADAYASGGLFYVEEKAHDIDTDFGAIAPWYRFVAEHPEFFDPPQGMTNVAILQLWEQYEGWPKPALLGAAAILADDGWQFDVVLSGEDIQPEFPGFNRLASLETLQRYPVLVIPRLEYCWTCTSLAGVKGFGITANHAQLLLDYVESGGSLLVFASDNTMDNFLARDPDPTAQEFYQQLLAAPPTRSERRIVRVRDAWPDTYFSSQPAALREDLSRLLEASGATHHVRLEGPRRAVSAFARKGQGVTVIHLVNYDYDRPSDTTNPVTNLVVKVTGLPGVTAVTAFSPDMPIGVPAPFTVAGEETTITVPGIQPWTVLSLAGC